MSILQALGYPNRIVALLTPIVAPLAGWFASFIADRVPGIPKSALDEIFIAGAILVLAPALQFLHGRLKWDLQQDQKQADALGGAGAAPAPSAAQFDEIGIAPPTASVAVQDDESMSDDDESIEAIASGAPDGAGDVGDEEEDASTDILDEVDGLLDDEDEAAAPVGTGS